MTPAIKMAESEYMIPVNFMKEVEELSEFEKKDRLSIIKEVFEIGLEEKRKEVALELYKKGDVSLERGAEIAKLPLLDFIDLIEKEKIFRKIDVDNIRKLILEEFNTEI